MELAKRPFTKRDGVKFRIGREMATNSPPALSYRQTPVMKDYVLTERLGSGSYATVYKGFSKVKLILSLT